MANIYDMSDTWNDGATTFTSIKMDVTDTASASGSLLMDLQVGGASKFSVGKSGDVIVPAESYFGVTGGSRFMARATSSRVYAGAVLNIECAANDGVTIGPSLGILTGLNSARLYADAADTLAQRRSTNAQTFNLYNTYTDASNYERGFMKWSSNVLEIGTEAAGTGTARALEFQTDGTTALIISSNQALQFGGTTSSFPALKPSGTSLEVKRADDSLYTNIVASSFSARSWYIDFHQRARVKGSGVSTIQLSNIAETDFDRLQFGGTTSSFPAIKRSTTSLQARLADDTDFTNIQGKLTTETAYTAGAPTATGYIVLYDSTGTAYKVPAEAL